MCSNDTYESAYHTSTPSSLSNIFLWYKNKEMNKMNESINKPMSGNFKMSVLFIVCVHHKCFIQWERSLYPTTLTVGPQCENPAVFAFPMQEEWLTFMSAVCPPGMLLSPCNKTSSSFAPDFRIHFGLHCKMKISTFNITQSRHLVALTDLSYVCVWCQVYV